MRDHRSVELERIALHRAVAEKLDDDVLRLAEVRLARWREQRSIPESDLQSWERLLRGSRAELIQALVEDSVRMQQLRQNTPFAGALTTAEREEVLKRCRLSLRA